MGNSVIKKYNRNKVIKLQDFTLSSKITAKVRLPQYIVVSVRAESKL